MAKLSRRFIFQTFLILGLICFNIVYVLTALKPRIIMLKQPTKIETWSNLTSEICTRSFYRFTEKTDGGDAISKSPIEFDRDIYLVGVSSIACLHAPQDYYVIISEKIQAKFVEEKDKYGNAPYDVIGKIFFFGRLNTKSGILSIEQFLPNGYGFFIPKGYTIYLTLSSIESGHGGMVSIYFVQAK